MNDLTPMTYEDPTPKEVQVTIGSQQYVLREASGGTAIKWENAKLKYQKFGTDGNPTVMEGLASTKSLLLSMCLFEAELTKEGKSKPVPESVITSWPSRIQQDLFDRCKRISGLHEKLDKATLVKNIAEMQADLTEIEKTEKQQEKSQEKNEWSAGMDGSA